MNGFDKDRYVAVEEESVGDLLKDLRDEAFTMIKQQIELAKTETSEKVSSLGKNSAYLLAGGLVVYAGILFLLAGLTLLGYVGLIAAGVSPAISLWLMPLITGVIVGLIGYGFVKKALKTFKGTSVVPQKTVHSLKEDKQWITRKRK
ncbi:phage holin family protein [Chitinispirillales bacterium ANBcel5]|uniref:phage holin family protein n=1 Tax=Cellulosispirillum alkaliphilum TaxID=3039283 RepID=UPI002A50007C|nr:phage holin family protein [Chitinispirillales bacterium ANBcel5]